MEFWDVKKKQMISNPRAPDSTAYAWAPDGVHVMTATTAPRLRVGNGNKAWHYDGTCIFQVARKGDVSDPGRERVGELVHLP